MKPRELNNKEARELSALLAESREKLVQLGFDIADRKTKDTSQVKKLKKDIARILTTLRVQGSHSGK